MINTKRLILKPLNYKELVDYSTSISGFIKKYDYIGNKQELGVEEIDAIQNSLLPNLKSAEKDFEFQTMWIIVEKATNALIGGLCFHGAPDEFCEIELGYGIDEEYRNRGYMSEALQGIISWARERNDIKTLKAETANDNISSLKTLERAGFELAEKNEEMSIYLKKVALID